MVRSGLKWCLRQLSLLHPWNAGTCIVCACMYDKSMWQQMMLYLCVLECTMIQKQVSVEAF